MSDAAGTILIETGLIPGALGRCIAMHALYYARTAGFGVLFESRVAAGLAEFAPRAERPCNRFWRAMQDGCVVGTLAIDGEDLGEGRAHLRWFIVDDGLRGAGLGRRLLAQALAFCDAQGFAETHLWTFEGLAAARRLYEAAGFRLVEAQRGSQWGSEVLEQRFVRKKAAVGSTQSQR